MTTLVPQTVTGLLSEIARIANDYDLRERIDEHDDAIADSFIWRDCIEAANAIVDGSGNRRDGEARLDGDSHDSDGAKGNRLCEICGKPSSKYICESCAVEGWVCEADRPTSTGGEA